MAFSIIMSQAGFDPATARLEGECSIQLSYYDVLFNNLLSIQYKVAVCQQKTLNCLVILNFHLNIPFTFSQLYVYERIINLGGDILEVQTVITTYYFTNDDYYTIKSSRKQLDD